MTFLRPKRRHFFVNARKLLISMTFARRNGLFRIDNTTTAYPYFIGGLMRPVENALGKWRFTQY